MKLLFVSMKDRLSNFDLCIYFRRKEPFVMLNTFDLCIYFRGKEPFVMLYDCQVCDALLVPI